MAELIRDVAAVAGKLGLLIHQACDNSAHRGFPDLTVTGPRGVMYAQDKGAKLWTETVHKNAITIHEVLRPDDLASGRIETILAAIAAR